MTMTGEGYCPPGDGHRIRNLSFAIRAAVYVDVRHRHPATGS